MVVQDIVSIGAPLAAVAVVGAGFVWQMMRRRTKKPPMPSVAHRDKEQSSPRRKRHRTMRKPNRRPSLILKPWDRGAPGCLR